MIAFLIKTKPNQKESKSNDSNSSCDGTGHRRYPNQTRVRKEVWAEGLKQSKRKKKW